MSFCIACRRSVTDIFGFVSSRVVPVVVITALLSPAFFIIFSRAAEASGRIPKKAVIAPPSAPPEPFIIGGQKTNPVLAILAVEALASIKTSVLAMFVDTNADENTEAPLSVARTLVRAPFATENTEGKEKSVSNAEARTLVRANRRSPDDALANERALANETTEAVPPQPASIVDFDFDNDGKTDIGRWKPGASEFEIDPSGGGANLVYDIGSPTSKFVPGDFNGDGKTDAAVFDSGTWKYKIEANNPLATEYTITLGQSGDIPVPANYDNHGETDAAVFRPSNGTWHIKQSSTGSTVSMVFGTAGDVPVVGDYDGDAVADIAVFRPSTGYWHVQGSTTGYSTFPWGLSSDVPTPADYDGDGKTDPAVYRGSTGTWYALKSSTGYATHETRVWGSYGDQPVPGDYDGDNKADFAVWRPTTGVWYIAKSSGGYEYHTLGVPGDRAVPSAFIKQIGGEVAPYELAKARLAPRNATGGTDLYSQNFSWGTSLVGLPGRAGLNAGFGMSYNSLVWTKEGNNVHFDTNYDNISPGFRFGFPTIEAPYYVPGTGETANPYFAYVMVSPSGARTEFRQIGASEFFETADSSYLQLETATAPDPNTPVEDITLTVRGTDGTQMEYVWIAGAFRCTQVKDRNGNFITIETDELGLLRKVTDTLGREINVGYSEDLYPTSITQTWKTNNGGGSNTTHTWATFGYANITLNPTWNPAITSTGPPAGTILKVLERVTFPDASSTKFSYNTYGQVAKIENIAADSPLHVLNYVRTNLESPGSNLVDAPRLGETRTFVENFNSGQETVVTNTLSSGHQVADIDGATVTVSMIQVAMQNHPTGNVTNTCVGETGWMEGLPILINDYADGDYYTPKRSSWTRWTQDDPNSADVLNPRVIETKIGDGINLKRSTIDYLLYPSTTVSKFGLVSSVNVYDTNQSTVLKRAETDYNFASAYIDRRIIGLPLETRSYGWNDATSSLELASRMTYAYDEEDFQQETNQIISPIRHDTGKYGSDFIVGRGLLTSVTRHDVLSQSSAVISRTRYDIAGSVVAKLDPLGRKVRLEYTDVFNDSSTPGSFAYPTKVYDPANNFFEVKYRFDIGANVWAGSPAPAGNSVGKMTERIFDSLGRLEKEIILNTGAYTRYEYPTNGIQSKVFSTIIDTNANGADTADEVLTESWSDGAGRVRKSRTEHPGSTGGYSGSLVEYDILGRATRQSVPTEIDTSWNPAGDDATRGFLWTYQKYDWMNRVTRKINTDGIDSPTLNDSDVLISYTGCGCAGGAVVTVQGPRIMQSYGIGQTETEMGRRTQRLESDILGRETKAILYEWDGSTVYSTITTEYNGRDQIARRRHYQGTDGSTTFQQAIFTYDGHGRRKTQHTPEQDSEASVVFNYNPDDSIQNVTDARGAVRNFTYNSLGLPMGISYAAPTGISVPANTTFAYDNAGNRIQMTDGLGTIVYAYDSLSRITSETRQFNSSQPSALQNRTFALTYAYQLSGTLKSITDPYEETINYSYEKTGRLLKVEGTAFGTNSSVDEYLKNVQYRAWGAVKQADYGDYNHRLEQTFETSSLKLATYKITNLATSGVFLRKDYYYYADGQARFIRQNYVSQNQDRFDRYVEYDFAGRMTKAFTGDQARTGTQNPTYDNFRPYTQSLTYDTWGNVTTRATKHWTRPFNQTNDFDEATNREVTWEYDSDGRVTRVPPTSNHESKTYTYKHDAAGRLTVSDSFFQNQEQYAIRSSVAYDGDGQVAQRKQVTNYGTPPTEKYNFYFIRSSVIGGDVTEIDKDARKRQTIIYAYGKPLAMQRVRYTSNPTTTTESVVWDVTDPSGTSVRGVGFTELDPTGTDVGRSNPYLEEEPEVIDPDRYEQFYPYIGGGAGGQGNWRCQVDGIYVPCGSISSSGTVRQNGPNSIRVRYNGQNVWAWFTATGDGYAGYIPTNATYLGGGQIEPIGGVNNYRVHYTELAALARRNGQSNWVNAVEFGQVLQRQDDKIVKVPLPDNFKDLLRKRLKAKQPGQTENCNSFIARMIKYVNDKFEKELSDLRKRVNFPHTRTEPAAPDGLGLVDKISKFTLVEGGITLNGHGAGGTVSGSIGGGDAEVLISGKWYYSPHARNTNPVAMWTKWYIGTAIHEIVHLARRGVMSDGRLAEAAHAMGDSKVEVLDPDTNDMTKIYKYSDAWNEALAKYCGAR